MVFGPARNVCVVGLCAVAAVAGVSAARARKRGRTPGKRPDVFSVLAFLTCFPERSELLAPRFAFSFISTLNSEGSWTDTSPQLEQSAGARVSNLTATNDTSMLDVSK